MNDGKICVSVFAETAEELIALIQRAERHADVIELRLDRLATGQIEELPRKLSSTKQILLTMRPKEQGGRAEMDREGRAEFWRRLSESGSIGEASVWIDNEYDLAGEKFWRPEGGLIVRSRHFFETGEPDLSAAYESVMADSDAGKIAVMASDAADAIGIWKLLTRANADNRRFVPIAMGEGGKWTRILGPAHGTFMTYAALEAGSEAAPGQITAEDLAEVFRVRELDRETDVYGIIAGNTSYSVSPWMHNAAFKATGLNSVFVPMRVTDLDRFMNTMVLPQSREIGLNFQGFAVTNPHKQAIMAFLDEIDETAARIGAVNTVKIESGRLYGYNTDAFGFISTLESEFGSVRDARVAVFGAGGAGRACVCSLTDKRANVMVFARDESKGRSLAEEFGAEFERFDEQIEIPGGCDIVVNTTPLGTAGPGVDRSILDASRLKGIKLVYDLVYNPSETRLMHEARAAGVKAVGGMAMIVAQGTKQFELWTGLEAPEDAMRAAIDKRLGTT